MNVNFGFSMTVVMTLLMILVTIIFKVQNNRFYFNLSLIATIINISGNFLFFPLLTHPDAKFIWYLSWVYIELPFIGYITFHVYKTKSADLSLFLLALLSMVSASVNFFRFIERHYSDLEIIKSIYPYSSNITSVATIAIFISVAFQFQQIHNPPYKPYE